MRDIRQIVADNGNDNTPAMDSHNLTGRAVRCSVCGDSIIGMPIGSTECRLCNRLFEYDPSREIAFND